MSDQGATGTRLRMRRMDLGLRQADVAQKAGISASYLNLIEHNRRRIGAHLTQKLAQVLEVDVRALDEGGDEAVLQPLRSAAADYPQTGVDGATADELVARFPAWAGVVTAQAARIAQLEARVQGLSDRLAHDTQIAGSLHEVISTATAIRSTASILAETPDLDAGWRARFHGNIDTDSARLAESSQALLGFLDMEIEGAGGALATPLEAAEAYLAARGFYVEEAERQEMPVFGPEVDRATRVILERWIARAGRDAALLPLDAFEQAARAVAYDPARLAARFEAPLEVVLRRLAHLPRKSASGTDHPLMGLVECDAAGVITYQHPILDFRLPRAGAACPLWPLYQALTQPGRAIARTVRMPGAARTTFECFAVAGPQGAVQFAAEPRVAATMLVRPKAADDGAGQVGPGCRLCPVKDCDSRRHPSLLGTDDTERG
ncbi:helix-turn-helix transcriptional regulator [Pseudooctadecabacter jejudonensis]|uniref:Helix-turn-helix domain protein n=1 Tax=Pseudooctadecabacter jejudonensis TaxID=1391910 RepID=A0A1Y5TFB4_9RHOB|nr:helix-turn-helix transcriptional regulator [Pseudooctadecabacter jejudonensis]SLN60576.1 Helix-turn-helix domain protein [Pseudooctadecabacter jejudonensis]